MRGASGPTGRLHHLFDPRTGASACASVSVLAPTATAADALATGCHLLPPAAIVPALAAARARRAVIIDDKGMVSTISAA
ncbi:MAG: FAD:protein FMN transferase [Alphaproteobacteria bacterium]|nr:FAD:protein FMN transferase [Alphaproteobacteria bacterium]